MIKAVINIDRVGKSALTAYDRHHRRNIGDVSHTYPERTKLNNRWLRSGNTTKEAAEDFIAQKKPKIDKRNEKPFTRIVLSASHDYFFNEDETFNERRLKAWKNKSVGFLRKEFGDDLLEVQIHFDEKTPHIHALVMPTYTKTTKRGQTRQASHHKHPSFTGENSYADFHDRYAQALVETGIERGDRQPPAAPKKKHMTKREWIYSMFKSLKVFKKEAEKRAAAITRNAVELQESAENAVAEYAKKNKDLEITAAAVQKLAQDLKRPEIAEKARLLRKNGPRQNERG